MKIKLLFISTLFLLFTVVSLTYIITVQKGEILKLIGNHTIMTYQSDIMRENIRLTGQLDTALHGYYDYYYKFENSKIKLKETEQELKYYKNKFKQINTIHHDCNIKH